MLSLLALGESSSDKKKKKKKKKRGKKRRGEDSSEEDVPRPVVMVEEGEMPDGAMASDEERERIGRAGHQTNKVEDALDQNLDM